MQNGWLDTVTQGNGTGVDYDYDNAGRVTKILNTQAGGALLSQFDYSYDDNGNRTQQIETQNGFTADKVVTTDYVYDDLDRLETFTHTTTDNGTVSGVEQHSYTFYPSYDRQTETVVKDSVTQTQRTYTYDETYWVETIEEAAPGKAGIITYAYDANGNTQTKTNTTGDGPASSVFTYNNRNQLKTVAAGNAGGEVGQGQYHYNYTGMRIRHLGSSRGDIEYVYDDKSIIDEVVSGTTTPIAHYRYGDRLLSLETSGAEQFYHYASLGTTANLTDANGQNQVAYRVDPYGEITKQEGESVNRQVFTGHEHDTETGLIYMKARFYDPDIGRFLTQDTYLGEHGTPPSLHRYLYAYGNPTIYVDLYGNASLLWSGQQFDDYGAELYHNGNKIGAAGVAIAGSFYKVGTGFFSLGLFDEGNQAITDNDTYTGAAKQFGNSIADTAKETAQEYVEEGVVAGSVTVAGKFACGRFRQACDTAIDTVKKAADKLDTDIRVTKESPSSSDTETFKLGEPSDPYDVDAWEKFYEQNPNYRRSVGSAGNNDETELTDFLKGEKRTEARIHAQEAQEKGCCLTGVWDPSGAQKRRRERLRDIETKPELDRDEFPPAAIRLDEESAYSVKHIKYSDNRSSGRGLGVEAKEKGLKPGDRVRIEVPDDE